MQGFLKSVGTLMVFAALASVLTLAQDIPDAPQPKVQTPASTPFPADAPPAPKNDHRTDPPAATSSTGGDLLNQVPSADPGATDGIATSRNDLFSIRKRVTFVEVPVTVKDSRGVLVEGLSAKDFAVYEDGELQKLSFFDSEPFPLSAAVVIDTNLPSSTLKKINETLPALVGAFSQFDEVALYRYGTSVQQLEGFNSAGGISTAALEQLKRAGKPGGPPVVGGPFGAPSINNHPIEPQVGTIYTTAPQEDNVLNDAILRAAQDLSRREKNVRRRIIFVVSDGREFRSKAKFDEVKKYLLSQNITVYGIGVDVDAIPIYDKLNRIRLPGFGYGDVLSRYAIETGGDTFAELDQRAIERAYEKVTNQARNQYTLGYNTAATLASTYRTIEVHVHRANLSVTAKSGYYSLPPSPPSPTQADQNPANH
jgi:VWFA-related protein